MVRERLEAKLMERLACAVMLMELVWVLVMVPELLFLVP